MNRIEEQQQSIWQLLLVNAGRFLLAIGIPLITFYVLYIGFLFLRDSEAPQIVITTVAIVWGVGGVGVLYWVFNYIVELLPDAWRGRLLPYVFAGPALQLWHGI